MPALNVEFSDDELAVARVAAADAGMSTRSFCRRTVLDKSGDRAGRVGAVAATALTWDRISARLPAFAE